MRAPKCLITTLLVIAISPTLHAKDRDVHLPKGVKAVWDLSKAHRDRTATRERISINGLWRWQPEGETGDLPPEAGWGYLKVPGCWPGITDYMQKDCQTLYAHPDWRDTRLRDVRAAWHQREITVPRSFENRRILLRAELLNSLATVFIDGREIGEMRFPEGELDLTAACRPGRTHRLTLLVTAAPLQAVMLSFSDTAAAREVKGDVRRRGLCGDVWLIGEPKGPRMADFRVTTDLRRHEITFDAALDGLSPRGRYRLASVVKLPGGTDLEFASRPFGAGDLIDGRLTFTGKHEAASLWDLHTPENVCEAALTLTKAGADVLDESHPVRFAFREFRIEGRDFILNGKRVFLSAVPLDNAQVGAAWATYEGARESLSRLKSFGINFVYTHNYGCQPGSHLSFTEVLRAADDVGMLVSLSQPDVGHYGWKAADAEAANGYADHAAFYTRVAGSHPSVVAYGTSHNATGYSGDMDPDLIDGVADPRQPWSKSSAATALRAEAIIRRLDPSRVVYHHSSGNLGSMHTSNFYANFAPAQELSDWFMHWATNGVKPLFLCEYGAPLSWDWTMYRGWYKGRREFGSASVPWEFCLAEWNAQFLGDRAYEIGEEERANIRFEAAQFCAGRLWHRWDYPHAVGSNVFRSRDPIYAEYLRDNFRAFRTHGVSAVSPWAFGHYWRPGDGVDRSRREYRTDWSRLQRPGFSPDCREGRYERMDLAFGRDEWVSSAAADALIRVNGPVLAYIGGRAGAFTEQGHSFLPGETVEKELIVVNNSRRPLQCAGKWRFGLPRVVTGEFEVSVATGEQARVGLELPLPDDLAAGRYELSASVVCGDQGTLDDTFAVHVLPRPEPPAKGDRIALFDPAGETERLLRGLGVGFRKVKAGASLQGIDTLIVGRAALGLDAPAPDLRRVRDGLKVIVFEQTPAALERRLGFRVAEYGFRRVFPRVPDHPILEGIGAEHLENWRGAATLLPPRLPLTMDPRRGPTVTWCGIPETRIWRCGNRGNVASVALEKPARGDFLPIIDCGFSLQYSPLLEFSEGDGLLLLCQLDVTGRTEAEPVADRLVRNLLEYARTFEPKPAKHVVYVGEEAGRAHLLRAGFAPREFRSGKLTDAEVLVVGPGGKARAGRGGALGVGLSEEEARALGPVKIRLRRAEHIASWFPPHPNGSLLAGVCPADVMNRDPRELDLVAGGLDVVGNGVLAYGEKPALVMCQLAPWSFDPAGTGNRRKTFRRVSCLLARLLANLGCRGATPLLDRFVEPVEAGAQRWLTGLYLDEPEEWDDPYRFFRW